MDLLSNLALGFGVALLPVNLLYALSGCVLGTLIGVLPGIGPVTAIALLLPASYALQPVSALILLAGIYYGAQYGFSITAILVKRPDESAAGLPCNDGCQMARQGRAGPALAAAGLASLFAGCVGAVLLAAFAPKLAEWVSGVGQVEYFSLMVLGLTGAAVLTSGSLLKAMGMVVLGLLLGLVGIDGYSGVVRFGFDVPELNGGIGLVVLAIGLFGYGPIISKLARPDPVREVFAAKVLGLWPTRQDLRDAAPAVLRGTVLGSLLGVLPGAGALLASCAASALESGVRSKPGEVPLGKGNIRGVAAPESATKAGAQTAFVAMLALGIPTNAVMALMAGAMTLHHIQPGPQVMSSNPDLFWGLISALWICHLMLMVLNLPLIGLWIKLLSVPYRWLFPAIVLLGAIGVYSIHSSTVDVWMLAALGCVGYVFHKLDLEPAALLLGFILGPMMEGSLRSALLSSHGDWSVFVMRPLSAALLLAAVCTLFLVLLPPLQSHRAQALEEA